VSPVALLPAVRGYQTAFGDNLMFVEGCLTAFDGFPQWLPAHSW
jgi:hypothetical protein